MEERAIHYRDERRSDGFGRRIAPRHCAELGSNGEILRRTPPRAAIALASASFDEELEQNILRTFRHLTDQYPGTETKKLKQAVPRGAEQRTRLAWALGLFPVGTLKDLEKIRKLRNNAIHKSEPLTPGNKERIRKAVRFLEDMKRYLANLRRTVTELGDRPPDPPILD